MRDGYSAALHGLSHARSLVPLYHPTVLYSTFLCTEYNRGDKGDARPPYPYPSRTAGLTS